MMRSHFPMFGLVIGAILCTLVQSTSLRQILVDGPHGDSDPRGRAGLVCDANWLASDGRTSCVRYEILNFCKKSGDHYGSGWKAEYGTFEDWADEAGRTALVCPQCGCTNTEKPGMCPVVHHGITESESSDGRRRALGPAGCMSDGCTSDDFCTGNLKCCPNVCDKNCQEPIALVVFQWPTFEPPEIMTSGICARRPDLPCCVETLRAHQDLNSGLSDFWSPSCRPDGYFAPMQCGMGGCNCVHPNGDAYESTSGSGFGGWAINCEVRLRGGNSKRGRVEVLHGDEWGTICDDNFSDKDASVICTMLFASLAMPEGSAFYDTNVPAGSGKIWLDEVQCNGDEGNITQCRHGGWGSHDCSHSEDVGVICGCWNCERITFYGSSTYVAVQQEKSWSDSKSFCQDYAGDLASFETDDEWRHVTAAMKQLDMGMTKTVHGHTISLPVHHWIGGQRTGGIWKWTTGQRIIGWENYEDPCDANECSCVQTHKDDEEVMIENNRCSHKTFFICELK